ncbi:Manganese transporter SMF2 [Neolecta irregularis DAH-3]|uniref:Manganese transporter SMF2 n=1 Tax=Neolecta irregularis (strain DAH-3) TaxID=1198029 RepID=A0A1U7LS29_NEOID|nr:Manganese transporter SMF2 [Neolecta irregularis DAH-3]|eukprot:OLL25467.1 Manganese transporter SMF2 [Neolecta irregularis DAH-3]
MRDPEPARRPGSKHSRPSIDLRLLRTSLSSKNAAKPENAVLVQSVRHMHTVSSNDQDRGSSHSYKKPHTVISKTVVFARRWAKVVGPGILISVAYLDPGNFSTATSAGAQFRFKLLFITFLSNCFALYLQAISCQLGTVTGLDLATCCRVHLPRWLNYIIYAFAEVCIIATDIAEVIGSAIALNILFNIPLTAGITITTLDVLLVLLAWRPRGSMRGLRFFEAFVACLVAAVVICFIILLANVSNIDATEVMKGFLPSKTLFEKDALYCSVGILGATVMPHSLFLGSGLVQPRLREYDLQHNNVIVSDFEYNDTIYRPTLDAIRSTLAFSIAEVAVSLLTFAFFVNSAILIVAGATLSDIPDAADADLFAINHLLRSQLSTAAGVIFAVALLCSGFSGGIVTTMVGQQIAEGFIQWKIRPWLRRLLTRCIALIPSLIVAIVVGRSGLNVVLNATQVILSIILPIVAGPMLYFASSKKVMNVPVLRDDSSTISLFTSDNTSCHRQNEDHVNMAHGWILSSISIFVWVFIAGLNLFMLIQMALGNS